MKILVTGVLGFIGSHYARTALAAGHHVVGLNRPTNESKFKRIADFKDDKNFDLILRDLDGDLSELLDGIDVVVHMAAKTYVDHSIRNPGPFIESNIIGTYNLLEAARKCLPKLFIQFSTDEVYGSILEGAYKEDAPLNPTNPYSSSKAAGDMLALSYFNTYKLPVIITRTENNFGPFQHPQKAMPKFVQHAIAGKKLPVYGDGGHVRQWLYVDDTCSALDTLIAKGKPGEIYHIAGNQELTNIDLAKKVLSFFAKPESQIEFIDDRNIRPGHDRRYALDCSKLMSLGWKPKYSLDEGLAKTFTWYRDNAWWFETA